jgi:hypothetical protein
LFATAVRSSILEKSGKRAVVEDDMKKGQVRDIRSFDGLLSHDGRFPLRCLSTLRIAGNGE